MLNDFFRQISLSVTTFKAFLQHHLWQPVIRVKEEKKTFSMACKKKELNRFV